MILAPCLDRKCKIPTMKACVTHKLGSWTCHKNCKQLSTDRNGIQEAHLSTSYSVSRTHDMSFATVLLQATTKLAAHTRRGAPTPRRAHHATGTNSVNRTGRRNPTKQSQKPNPAAARGVSFLACSFLSCFLDTFFAALSQIPCFSSGCFDDFWC